MAAPESPEDCVRIVAAMQRSRALMLYDFPELYDPLTQRVIERLGSYRQVTVTDISLCRSKDREAPDNPRNYKRMVPIQYQESVHCLAFVLYVLAHLRGSVAEVFDGGVTLRGESASYVPPNPEIYPHAVDGRCRYQLSLGGARIEGLTDFRAGAEFTKRRILRGRGDGRPFCIELDYLEGHKRLCIDGIEQMIDRQGDSYAAVLRTFTRWRRENSRDELMQGLYPNPAFARITYQLSSALWRASRNRTGLSFAHLDELLEFDAGFRDALPPVRPATTGN
jgi:predicted dehydrogenase